MRSGKALALAVALGLGATAGDREEPREAPAFQARFAVRGRWQGPRAIAYRIDTGGAAPAELPDAIRSALGQWEGAGCAYFHESGAAEEPALTFAWGCDGRGDDVPFGADPSIAHAGPVGPGTFVHFDPERAWDAESLQRAALHEIGHVLGL